MNEKVILRFIFGIVVLFSFHLGGCRTVGGYTDETVLQHQRRIIELENANRALTERIGQYDTLIARTVERLEAIRERAASIRDTAERVEYLFAEYERAVQQLIYVLRQNGGEVGKGAESYEDIVNYLALLDGSESFADYCRVYMAGYQ